MRVVARCAFDATRLYSRCYEFSSSESSEITIRSSSSYSGSSPKVQVTHEVSSPIPRPTGSFYAQGMSEFAATAALEPGHPAQQVSFKSKLSKLSEEFVNIKSDDYERCYTFMKKHSQILQKDRKEFLKDASQALVAGMDSRANCCVQRAVMLQECASSTPKKMKSFFEDLMDKKPKALDSFLKDCDDALAKLKAQLQLPAPNERTSAQSTSLQTGLGAMSLQKTTDRHGKEKEYFNSVPGLTPRLHLDPSDRQHSVGMYGQPAALGYDRRRNVTSDGPTEVGPEGKPDVLDSDYKVRKESSKFFTFGRVFAIAWHQSFGDDQPNSKIQNWVTYDRFNQPILTHIQRMAVVKEGHGFCWCVPINSYNGKGVAKSGLSSSDRAAHAVIYMEGTQPVTSKAEQKMMKKSAIAVGPAVPDRKLDAMSRINFGKVHTIEHNVKVMNVGNIRHESLEYFEAYWNATSGETNRIEGR
jgi:hypothetical protein